MEITKQTTVSIGVITLAVSTVIGTIAYARQYVLDQDRIVMQWSQEKLDQNELDDTDFKLRRLEDIEKTRPLDSREQREKKWLEERWKMLEKRIKDNKS